MWAVGWRRDLSLAIITALSMLVFPSFLFTAWSGEPADPYTGLREATKQYIAPGTPDDLLRLREVLDKTEQEIARLRLEVPAERQEQFAEKQARLKKMKDRLAEVQALLQVLDSSRREISKKQLDPVTTKERELLRGALSGQNDDLRKGIAGLEKEIRSDQAEYLRTLEEERKALARLLTGRREQLLAEYQALSGCTAEDRPCLARKLKILCRLTPLFPSGERAPILMLLEETTNQLNLRLEEGTHRPTVGHGSSSSLCEYLRRDFAL